MKCQCCGIQTPEFESFEGQCQGCYEDPEKIPLIVTLGYIMVVSFLLVIICL